MSVAKGLFLRALRICSAEFLDEEICIIKSSLKSLAYPDHVLNNALSSARKTFYSSHSTNRPFSSSNKLFIPYLPSLDTINNKRLAKSFNSDIIFNYPNTLKSNLVSNTPKASTNSGVYRINCNNCNKFYIGESGRDIKTRIKEHKLAISYCNPNNALFIHMLNSNHSFNFDSSHLIYKCNNNITRRILEAAFIKVNNDHTVNLDSGFFTVNKHIASCLIKSIK